MDEVLTEIEKILKDKEALTGVGVAKLTKLLKLVKQKQEINVKILSKTQQFIETIEREIKKRK